MKKVEALDEICFTGKIAFHLKTKECFHCDSSDMVRAIYLPNEKQWTRISDDSWAEEQLNLDWYQEGWCVSRLEYDDDELEIWI